MEADTGSPDYFYHMEPNNIYIYNHHDSLIHAGNRFVNT